MMYLLELARDKLSEPFFFFGGEGGGGEDFVRGGRAFLKHK